MLDWLLVHASRQTCRALTGNDEAFCSLAWRLREQNVIAKLWAGLFPAHCQASFLRYHGKD